jgi:hypothetical protein
MTQEATHATPKELPVDVKIHYLPATRALRHPYNDETVLVTVRADAMTFFGVQDHTDRDRHEFFLEFEAHRIINTSQTLEQLFGRDRREATFNLVEQITAGTR